MDSDCDSIQLSLGQTRLLQKWRDILCTPRGGAVARKQVVGAEGGLGLPPPVTDWRKPDIGTESPPEIPATTSTLGRDKELMELMRLLQLGAGDELWEEAGDTNDPRPQGMLKPLLVPDFVTGDGR